MQDVKEFEQQLYRLKELDFRVLAPGVNPGELHLLHTLARSKEEAGSGKVRVSSLARCGRMPAPAVSRGLRLAEKKGLIVRNVDPDDRRNTLVDFTKEGRQVFERFRHSTDAFFSAVLGRFDEAEQKMMTKALGAFIDAAEQELAKRRDLAGCQGTDGRKEAADAADL